MIGDQSQSREDDTQGYRIFGYEFSVSVANGAVAARLGEILRPFTSAAVPSHNAYRLEHEPDAPVDPWLLTLDGAMLSASPDRDAVVEYLVWHVNTHALKHAPDRVLVHAGSVVAPGGGAVLLVGESGAGKSTLVTALVRDGWGYLSDELAVIDPTSLLVEPHARPIHLKRGSPALLPRHVEPEPVMGNWHLPVEEVRTGALAEAQQLTAIVRLDPREAGQPTVAAVTPGAAGAALARHVLNPKDHRGTLLPLIRDLAVGARCLALAPGDLSQSVRILTAALDDGAATSKGEPYASYGG